MSTTYIGLNIERRLSDLDSKSLSLINLGLDRSDIDLIGRIDDVSLYGGGSAVTVNDFHLLSGLKEDRQISFGSLTDAGANIKIALDGIRDITTGLYHDIQIDNKFISRSIRYNYLNLDAVGSTSPDAIKVADLTNLRFSAFSEVVDGMTAYSGKVKVIGNKVLLTTGGKLITKTFPSKRTFNTFGKKSSSSGKTSAV